MDDEDNWAGFRCGTNQKMFSTEKREKVKRAIKPKKKWLYNTDESAQRNSKK